MEDPNLSRQFDPLFHTSAEQYGVLSGITPSTNGNTNNNNNPSTTGTNHNSHSSNPNQTDYGTSLDIFKQKEKPPTTSAPSYVDLDQFYTHEQQQQRPHKMLKPNHYEDSSSFHHHYPSSTTSIPSSHWNVSMSHGMGFASLHQQSQQCQQLLPQHLDAYAMPAPHLNHEDSSTSPVSTNAGCKVDLDGLHRGSSPLSSIEYVQQQGKGAKGAGFFAGGGVNGNGGVRMSGAPPNGSANAQAVVNVQPAAAQVKSSGHTQDHIMAERKRREKLSQRFIALSAIVPGLKKVCVWGTWLSFA